MNTALDKTPDVVTFDVNEYIELIRREFEDQVGGPVANLLPIRLVGHPTDDQLMIIRGELDGYVHNHYRLLARRGGRVFYIEHV